MRATRSTDNRHPRTAISTRSWAALAFAAALLAGACASTSGPGAAAGSAPPSTSASASAPASSGAPTGPTATPSTTPTTPHGPSAADRLAGFFAAAGRMDRQIRAAAALVNSGFGAQSIQFAPNTAAEVLAIDPHTLAATIPGAMPAALQWQVLLVFSELASRRDALTAILDYQHELIPRDSASARFLIRRLGNGAPAAARYPADLAAARTLAASLPPIPAVAPASRAGAAIAVQAEYVMGMNGGCESAGGWIETSPVPLVWKQGADYLGQRTDGTIGGIVFRADYQTGHGWQVFINAC
jgi:hypothetical protein